MVLEGKAKEDFEKWYFETQCSSSMKFDELLPHHLHDVFGWLYNSNKTIQNAFVIEWFDSVDMHIHVDNLTNIVYPNNKYGWASYLKRPYRNRIKCCYGVVCRQEAIKQAIIKANETYNGK